MIAQHDVVRNSQKQEALPSSILLQKPGEQVRPNATLSCAVGMMLEDFGFDVSLVKRLNSYEDQNFYVQVLPAHTNRHVHTLWPYGYTLKILNSLESQRPEFVVAQNLLLKFLRGRGFSCPCPVASSNGLLYLVKKAVLTSTQARGGDIKTMGSQRHRQEKQHVVRLLTFIPGELLSNVPSTAGTLISVGLHLAKLHEYMKEFQHPSFQLRRTVWSLDCVPYLKLYVHAVQDEFRLTLVEDVIKTFEKKVQINIQHLPKGLIHGDYNEQNILLKLCSVKKDSMQKSYEVCGVLDFADVQWSCYVFDVAIGLMYMMNDWKETNPILSSGYFLAGYTSVRPLNEQEWEVLKVCVAARFCQSLVMGAYTHVLDPENDYLLCTQKKGWNLLSEFWTLPQAQLYSIWKNVSVNCIPK